ncbi:MAG TPA: chemotaxis protein CheW [Cellvibrionaceae bacterium]|nr:chemotaxis protein CheW [Cellvibrionaceae bacterium]HMW70721.1 chemotaxis protein CheW [Cellvibrionaceae bacterium]HNG58965.1 chemotaxis protein CheW [Cellvibrionaceae bacterium]
MSVQRKAKKAIVHAVATKQFLTFRIGNEQYGLELAQTREIIEYGGITSVPLMPNFLRGVINLRGEVVPVIDLAVRLGRKPVEVQKRTCIIVIELNNNEQNHVLGLLADAVSEVIEIDDDNIEDAPSFGANIRADFIQGIAKRDDEFVVLLDANNTLSIRELAHLVEADLQ